jgi:diguanylate cyclase
MSLTGRIDRIRERWRPALAPALADQLVIVQFERLQGRIPVLYLALAIIAIAAALASRGDFPPVMQYSFPGAMLGVSIVRFIVWFRRRNQNIDARAARKHLRWTLHLAIMMVICGSIWTVWGFLEAHETRRAMAAMFMVLGTFACANCLASVPRAAIAAPVLGIGPIGSVMIASGDLGMVAIGVSMIVVAMLQVRLIVSQFADTVQNLVLQAELARTADTDPLTGLLNRRAFMRDLDRRLIAGHGGPGFVVAMVDLNGFKPVNDRYGHRAGDAILEAVAQRLKSGVRRSDVVARLGGDEFAMILSAPQSLEALERRIARLAASLAVPVDIDGTAIAITASFGTACFPADAQSPEALLHRADQALYVSKSQRLPRAA